MAASKIWYWRRIRLCIAETFLNAVCFSVVIKPLSKLSVDTSVDRKESKHLEATCFPLQLFGIWDAFSINFVESATTGDLMLPSDEEVVIPIALLSLFDTTKLRIISNLSSYCINRVYMNEWKLKNVTWCSSVGLFSYGALYVERGI